jgi:glucan 1,3-beta-glucosidase
LEYIQVIAEFISQPQYQDVVTMFGVVNEPRATPYIGQANLASWYMEAYSIVRNASGYGEGNGPFISIHDGFETLHSWYGIFPNADRVSLDTHPYIAFGTQSSNAPGTFASVPCQIWGNNINDSMSNFGLTSAGEFSLAVNDCGLWVNGIFNGTRYEGTYPDPPPTAVGSCDQWNNWQTWSSDIKNGLMQFALTSIDALQNYFFWTWKIGNSTVSGQVEAPFWSYQLGLQQGRVYVHSPAYRSNFFFQMDSSGSSLRVGSLRIGWTIAGTIYRASSSLSNWRYRRRSNSRISH